MTKIPDFSFEDGLWKDGFTVIGIDEVGRGAFAEPVGVGGVVFDPKMSPKIREYLLKIGINDSKKLTPVKRKSFASIIREYATFCETEFIDVDVINKIGIGKATFMGMKKVFDKLSKKIIKPYALIDAFQIPGITKEIQKGVIYGDSLSISIAAASIMAKVARDELMQELAFQYPVYQWENNKGYGTLYHREAISKFGMSKLHRVEFCKKAVEFV